MARRSSVRAFAAAAAAMWLSCTAAAQVRIATWNLTEYDGASTRNAAFQSAIFGTFSGRSFVPDALVVQEVESAAAAGAFLALLNSAAGSPGDYAQATFFNGPDTDCACYFRTSKFDLQASVVAVVGNGFPFERNIVRYQLRLDGYTGAGATLYLYSAHLKASNTVADAAQRQQEAAAWRDNAETLPVGSNFIFAGDLNLYSSSGAPVEAAFTELTGSQANNDGRVFDPINKYSGWFGSGNSAVHTQSPTTASSFGGMDDRFDFVLPSAALIDGQGMDYIGNPAAAMSSNWNDPNHSYRVWGNDAGSYNATIRVINNAMVGPTVAQAILDHFAGTASPPHLPVFLDLKAPAKVSSVATVNFGTVNVGAIAQQMITISNGANVAVFSKAGDGTGIDDLTYSLGASAGFTAPAGTFNDPASPGGNAHLLSMNTSTPGVKNGMLTITSDDPDQPTRIVTLIGTVASLYDYDVNNDGQVSSEDLYAWHAAATDVDGSGGVGSADMVALRDHLRTGESAQIVNGRR